MKTAFIGGGRGCRAILEMLDGGNLDFLDLQVASVVDIDPNAPGMCFARARGWTTGESIERALAEPDLELVIELTGDDEVTEAVYWHLPPGVRVMDHKMAAVFWDLEGLSRSLAEQLRQKTELQVRLAEDRAELQEILDTIPDMVVVLDHRMRILRANRRFEEITGRRREDALGMDHDEVFGAIGDWAPCDDSVSTILEAIATGSPRTATSTLHGPPRPERTFQVHANPIFSAPGDVAGVVCTTREITEQVQLRRETIESARRFGQILDAVHGIITIKDLEGRYQVVNPRAEQVFGVSRDRFLNRTASEVLPPAVAGVIEENDRRAMEKRGYFSADEVIELADRPRELVAERFPLTDYRGEIVGLCYVGRDYTRQRELQRDLVRNERLAAIGKLAAGVAHEINNPLSGILTFAEDLLLEADEDDPRRADYEVIYHETLRCRQIVRELLEFSRQKTPQRERLVLREVVLRTLAIVERQASFHNIRFAVELDESLPAVSADPQQLQQVILNLVINARDAMSACGTITINGEPVEGGRAVAVSIRDTGCGIPEAALDDIFGPFFTTKGTEGYGLGLASVNSVVEQHGGRVEVDSEVGVGSTFRVILPSAEA